MSTIKELKEMNAQIEADIAQLSDRYRFDKVKKEFADWKQKFVNHVSSTVDPALLNMSIEKFLALPSEEQMMIRLASQAKGTAGATSGMSKKAFGKLSFADQAKYLDDGGTIAPDNAGTTTTARANNGKTISLSVFRKMDPGKQKETLDSGVEVVPD